MNMTPVGDTACTEISFVPFAGFMYAVIISSSCNKQMISVVARTDLSFLYLANNSYIAK